ncbi:MAG TPA: FAD-binding oxidoreductase [Rhizomicrobium sp.]|jgi:alkyldihydroxyacetonephosphate synthase
MNIRGILWTGWTAQADVLAMREPIWRWLAEAMGMPALLATLPLRLGDIALPPSRLTGAARAKLVALLGASGVRQDDAARAAHTAGSGTADLLRLRAGDLSNAPDAVLYPRNEADVLASLRVCAELGVAVVPFGGGTGTAAPSRGKHASVVTLNTSSLRRVTAIDTMSGLAEVEGGITGPGLERQLGERGMTLGHRPDAFEFSTLGGWIAEPGTGRDAARHGRVGDWLAGVRLATPQGLMTTWRDDLTHIVAGSQGTLGVITRATVRVRALPAHQEHRSYLFPDFASGITAVRQAAREGIALNTLRLFDDGETRFAHQLQRQGTASDLWGDLRARFYDIYREMRRFDSGAAAAVVGFSGNEDQIRSSRRRFDALAKRLGALPLGPDVQRYSTLARRETLLDRGVGVDSLEVDTSWAKLPSLYVAVRSALNQAMRSHAPRVGAHGLVLCHIGHARPDGASMTFTWLYARILEHDVAQAEAIRQAALTAAASHGEQHDALGRAFARAIKQTLDPTGILNPGKLSF